MPRRTASNRQSPVEAKYSALKRAVEEAGFLDPYVQEHRPGWDWLLCTAKKAPRGHTYFHACVSEVAGEWYLFTPHPYHYRFRDPANVPEVLVRLLTIKRRRSRINVESAGEYGRIGDFGQSLIPDELKTELIQIDEDIYLRALRHVSSVAPLTPADWPQVRAIYVDGIASAQATFETEAPSWEEWNATHHRFARLVARSDGRVIGWAALSPVSRRRCYAGVAEVGVYVAEECRGQGVGRRLLEALIAESERHGIWTLQGATFAENEASLRLQQSCGFREIGRRERIAQLNGVWRDTILMERRSTLIG